MGVSSYGENTKVVLENCVYREPEASCFQVFLLLYVLVVGEKDSEDGIYIPSVFSLSSKG